jgi:hypothetical protein
MNDHVDVLGFLAKQGKFPKRVGGENANFTCWFCNEDPSKPGRLYINVADDDRAGLWNCFRCGESGNAVTLWRHFGEELKAREEDPSKPTSRIPVMQAACAFFESAMTDDVMAYLTGPDRGLTEETIKRFRIGYAPGGHALYEHLVGKGFDREYIKQTGLVVRRDGWQDFFQQQIVIPYLTHGTAIDLRGKEVGGKYRSLPRATNRLFNAEAAHNVDEVIVAEGEMDAMVLEQLGFNAVGAPGAQTFEEGWEKLFETARRVWLLYDPDTAGQKGVERVKKRLPKAVSLNLPIPPGVTDPGKVDPSFLVGSQGWTVEHFNQLIADARRATSLLISPVDAFREWKHLQEAGGVRFGWPAMDRAIQPGLLPGQVVIPLARTNVGKSILLLNAMQSISMEHPDDVCLLFLSLEQTRAEWFERARRIWNFWNMECEPNEVHQETLKYWDSRFRMVDKNRLTPAQTVETIREFKREVAGDRQVVVCLDYLGYYARSFDGSPYEKTTNAVMYVKEFSKEERVITIAPHQANRGAEHGAEFVMDAARDSGAVEDTSDIAMTMWNPDTLQGNDMSQRTGTIRMKLAKTRSGGKGREFEFQFGYRTLALTARENPASKLLRAEVVWDDADVDWHDVIVAHRTGVPPRGFARIPGQGVSL